MGNIYLRAEKDTQTALTYFDQIIEADPENYLALSNIGGIFLRLDKLNLAESREKRSLVLVSPMGTIDSKKVIDEGTIASFSELNLKEKNGEELIGDSLELYLNNNHIAEVIERLASEMPTRTGLKIEQNGLVVNKEGELMVDQNLEQSTNNELTNPNPKTKMTEEEKKQADESIAENEKRKRETLDEIKNMTTEELLSDDIDIMDMFKGCKI
jgi:tetratricopeptide (TPR) repeat protein